MRSGLALSLSVLAVLAAPACSSGGSTPADTSVQDTAGADVLDVAPADTTPPDGMPEAVEPEVTADVWLDVLPLSCDEGQQHCLGSVLHVCQSNTWLTALDCASFGWDCKKGDCTAAGAETATESAWRQRIVDSSVGMALEPLELDSYGGWANSPAELGSPTASTYFTVQKLNGRWWFVTPEGHPFLSKGVTDVNYMGANLRDDKHHQGLVAKYGDEETWADASLQRLHQWGFNSAGPWSSGSMAQRLPHAVIILDSAGHAPRYPDFPVTDMWSEGFAQHALFVAQDRAGPYVGDPRLLGYFLDNELAWEPNWNTNLTLVQNYISFPEDAPGRLELLTFLQELSPTLAEFNAAWGTSLSAWEELAALTADELAPTTEKSIQITKAFAVHAFRKYAETAVAALKTVDPNHLVLGCRFHTYHWDELIVAAGDYFDVISLAFYSPVPPTAQTDVGAQMVDKPFLLEEFSFKAEDSGYWNVMNYAPVVPTQKDRAVEYAKYVEEWMRRPYAVAFHWYKWFDNPERDDNLIAGDNFGLMKPDDEPYWHLVDLMTVVNRRIEAWHVAGVK